MDTELEWVTTLFEDNDIDWWVESGTLLTLTRSGGLTKYDDDIDLAMWASDLDTLNELLPEFESREYKVQSRSYHGHRYKYQFIPEEGEAPYTPSRRRLIDLMVFRRCDGHAWTAHSRLTKWFERSGLETPIEMVSPLVERYARSTSGHMEMTSFPKSLLTDVLTLWLPLDFVDDRKYDSDLGVYVPASLDEYLTFRYGDWQTPVEEWSLTDDGAVTEREPVELLV